MSYRRLQRDLTTLIGIENDERSDPLIAFQQGIQKMLQFHCSVL